MAIILRHLHTCPSCDQTWECVCWKCDYLEELRCSFCKREQEGHRPTAYPTPMREGEPYPRAHSRPRLRQIRCITIE
jgi:hypothetical protein